MQAFTAIGQMPDEEIWQADEGDFQPWRRKVAYRKEAQDALIRPLLELLSFTKNRPSWGYAFRNGLFEISADDFHLIAGAMGVEVDRN